MTDSAFRMPPATENARGELRAVGFELEFAGVELGEAAGAVRDVFGGEVVEVGGFQRLVEGTSLGDFRIEADWRLLQDGRYLELLEGLGVPVEHADLERPLETLERMVGWLAEQVVPYEVTTPPIPLDELDRVEELREALAALKARGTGSRLRYALGLHLNPEVPALDGGTVLAHLRAFLALYDRLLEASKIDVARSLSPFIDEFPAPYRRRVLDPGYEPTLEELAADYVEHSPTRNRPLDLLPLLAHLLGEAAIGGVEEPELVRPRPAFHYRLPNCRIDEPGWTVAEEWNRWVEVEELAARPEELARLSAAALEGGPGEAVSLWKRLKERVVGRFRDEEEG